MSDTPDTSATKTGIEVSKVLRLRAMLQTIRTEVCDLDADDASLQRLASVHNQIESQLAGAIPAALGAELAEFSSCCHDNPSPSKAEIRVAQAQLIGWIEGLLQGVQLAVAAVGRELSEPAPVEEVTGDESGYGSNTYL
jgi:hypothetical protein